MKTNITNDEILAFIEESIHNDVESFINDIGYLLIPDDPRLNDEALCNLKKRFRKHFNQEE